MISPVKEGTERDNVAALMKLSASPEKEKKKNLLRKKKGGKLMAIQNMYARDIPPNPGTLLSGPCTEGT